MSYGLPAFLAAWLIVSVPLALIVGQALRKTRQAPTVDEMVEALAAQAIAEAERLTKGTP